MRVIAGKARSMPLKSVPGMDTRPTTDRIKETLFNMLQPYLCGARFLDLFSGSGGIGIEALSRGAQYCVFVEKNKRAAAVIAENLRFTRLAEEALLYNKDVFSVLPTLQGEEPFQCVFLDPPYNQGLERRVLELLKDMDFIAEDTLIVVEAALGTDFSYLEELGFSVLKEKRYKTNLHIFIQKGIKDT